MRPQSCPPGLYKIEEVFSAKKKIIVKLSLRILHEEGFDFPKNLNFVTRMKVGTL